jgi:ATP-binding cassette subfamily B protein
VATSKDADKIVVLDQGKIAEVGTHDQLIKQPGLYKRIFEIQTRMV